MTDLRSNAADSAYDQGDSRRSMRETLHLMQLDQERQQQLLAEATLVAQTKSRQLDDVTSALHSQMEAVQFGQQSLNDAAAGERLVDEALSQSAKRQRMEREDTRSLFLNSGERLQKSLDEHQQSLQALVADATSVNQLSEERSSSFTSTIGPLLLSDHEQKATLMQERVREKCVSELSAELLHAFAQGFGESGARKILSKSSDQNEGNRDGDDDEGSHHHPVNDGAELTLLAQLAKDVAEESDEVKAVAEELSRELCTELDVLLKQHITSTRWAESHPDHGKHLYGSDHHYRLSGGGGGIRADANRDTQEASTTSAAAIAAAANKKAATRSLFKDTAMKALRAEQLSQAEALAEQNRRLAEELQHEKIRHLRQQLEQRQGERGSVVVVDATTLHHQVDQQQQPQVVHTLLSTTSPRGAAQNQEQVVIQQSPPVRVGEGDEPLAVADSSAEVRTTSPQPPSPAPTQPSIPAAVVAADPFLLSPTSSSPAAAAAVTGMASPFGTVPHPTMTLVQRDEKDRKEETAVTNVDAEKVCFVRGFEGKRSTSTAGVSPAPTAAARTLVLKPPSPALLRAMYREMPNHHSTVQEVSRTQLQGLHLGLRGEVTPLPTSLRSSPQGLAGLRLGGQSQPKTKSVTSKSSPNAATVTRTRTPSSDSKPRRKDILLSRNVGSINSTSSLMAGGGYGQEELQALREHRRWR